MEDGQEHREEGWEARDLRSGVAKVYAEAKRRSTMGMRVTAVWAVVIFLFGTVDMAGVTSVAPPLWDFLAGFGTILMSALAVSRAPGPLLGAAMTIVADLGVVAYRFPEMLDHGSPGDYLGTAVRVAVAPVAVYFVLNGYFGSLSIQAFKLGFSPGADWRTRINPAMMQFIVIGSCIGALLLGVATWFGAIAGGFAQTDVVWITRSLLKKPIEIKTAKPADVAKGEFDGKDPGVFANINVLNGKDDHRDFKVPETAQPIDSLAGLDDYTKGEVEEAFEFAEDSDEAGCLQEAQGRQDRCRDDRCKYWSRVFSRACLTKSKKSEHFCENVPEPILVDAGTKWSENMCAGRNYELCREMLWTVQGHCHPPKPGEPKYGSVKVEAVTPPAAGNADATK